MLGAGCRICFGGAPGRRRRAGPAPHALGSPEEPSVSSAVSFLSRGPGALPQGLREASPTRALSLKLRGEWALLPSFLPFLFIKADKRGKEIREEPAQDRRRLGNSFYL